jgi:uncharacterized membrane protein (UPF0127 family)
VVRQWRLLNETTGDVLMRDVEIANSWWRRLCGLQFRKTFPQDKAILLVPCSSIHTHWMRFPIDVAMVDKHGVVLDVRENVKPWRIVNAPKNTFGVFEWFPKSVLVAVGDKLRVMAHPKEFAGTKPKYLEYLTID